MPPICKTSVVCWLGLLCISVTARSASDVSIYLRLESLTKQSEDLDSHYTDDQGNDIRVRYRLFRPKPFDANKKYPLIVWLHGWGDRGDDNVSQLMHLDPTIYSAERSDGFPFFLFAPQCSRASNRDWLTPLKIQSDRSHGVVNLRDMIDVTLQILDHVELNYPIDPQRITVVGISSGGSVCWESLHRQPQRFAAVVPLGAGSTESQLIGSLLATPIWAFHAAHDPDIAPDGVLETITAVKASGGTACLTTTDDNRHDCWTKAFAEHDLLDWILAQRRGDPNSPLPGYHPARVQLALWWGEFKLHSIVVALLLGLAVACSRHLKKTSCTRWQRSFGKDGT